MIEEGVNDKINHLSDQVQQLTGMNQELMQLLLKLNDRVTNVEQVLKTGTWEKV